MAMGVIITLTRVGRPLLDEDVFPRRVLWSTGRDRTITSSEPPHGVTSLGDWVPRGSSLYRVSGPHMVSSLRMVSGLSTRYPVSARHSVPTRYPIPRGISSPRGTKSLLAVPVFPHGAQSPCTAPKFHRGSRLHTVPHLYMTPGLHTMPGFKQNAHDRAPCAQTSSPRHSHGRRVPYPVDFIQGPSRS